MKVLKWLAISVIVIIALNYTYRYFVFQVGVGQIGVVVTNGRVDRLRGYGEHFYNPISEVIVFVPDRSNFRLSEKTAVLGDFVAEYSVLWDVCDPKTLVGVSGGFARGPIETAIGISVRAALAEAVRRGGSDLGVVHSVHQKELMRDSVNAEMSRRGVCVTDYSYILEKGNGVSP